MAVYTETINMDGNLAEQAERAAKEVAVLEKGLASAEAALVRANALGDAKGIESASKKIAAYGDAIDAVPPHLVEAKREADAFGSAMEKAGAMALTGAQAIGAAVLAVGAAVAGLALAGMKLALEAADAKGDLALLFQTLTGGAVAGDEAIAMFDRLGEATGRTREELGATARARSRSGPPETGSSTVRNAWFAASRALSGSHPARISDSMVRRLICFLSTRLQKSNRLVNGPPSWRAATIASMAAWPVPLTAPRP